VFTARYALSPYIKQIRFVFKGLNEHKNFTFLTNKKAADSYLICVMAIIATYKDSESTSSVLQAVNLIKCESATVHYTAHTVSILWNTSYFASVPVQLPNHIIHRVTTQCSARRATCSALCIVASHCNLLPYQRNAPTVLFTKPYIQYDTPFYLSSLCEGGESGPSTNGCCDNGRSLQMRRRPIV
jgi:hypothetical protein